MSMVYNYITTILVIPKNPKIHIKPTCFMPGKQILETKWKKFKSLRKNLTKVRKEQKKVLSPEAGKGTSYERERTL